MSPHLENGQNCIKVIDWCSSLTELLDAYFITPAHETKRQLYVSFQPTAQSHASNSPCVVIHHFALRLDERVIDDFHLGVDDRHPCQFQALLRVTLDREKIPQITQQKYHCTANVNLSRGGHLSGALNPNSPSHSPEQRPLRFHQVGDLCWTLWRILLTTLYVHPEHVAVGEWCI